MRRIFLPLMMIVCTWAPALGQTEEAKSQTTRHEASQERAKGECVSTDSKSSQPNQEGDPEAPQNNVEYGGGG
jgi:hypothetical protein